MATWVLVIILFGQGRASEQIEMNSREACIVAANEIKSWDSLYVSALCVNRNSGEVIPGVAQ